MVVSLLTYLRQLSEIIISIAVPVSNRIDQVVNKIDEWMDARYSRERNGKPNAFFNFPQTVMNGNLFSFLNGIPSARWKMPLNNGAPHSSLPDGISAPVSPPRWKYTIHRQPPVPLLHCESGGETKLGGSAPS